MIRCASSLVAAALIALTAGCSSGPPARRDLDLSPAQRAQLRAFLTTPSSSGTDMLAKSLPGSGPLPCDGNATRCDATIEVGIIRLPLERGLEGLERLIGTCYAVMPYERIDVSPKSDPQHTQRLEWTLVSVRSKDKVDIKDFEFCKETGAPGNTCNSPGIEFLPPGSVRTCSHPRTDDDFDSPDHVGGNKKKFVWRNKHDSARPGASFCHQANVRPDKVGVAGVIDGRCLQPDPLIVNQ